MCVCMCVCAWERGERECVIERELEGERNIESEWCVCVCGGGERKRECV